MDPLYELQKQIYPSVRTQSQHFLSCQSSFIIVSPSASARTLLHTAQSLRKTLTGALISPSFSSSSLCWCAFTRVLCHICKHLGVRFCFAEVLMLESLPIDATLCEKQPQILQLWKKSVIFLHFQFVLLLPSDITAASVLSVIPLMYRNEEK